MTSIASVKPHMPVICSEGGQFATVDHVSSDNRTIKLSKDATGKHHYIPFSWVTKVDNAVHIDARVTKPCGSGPAKPRKPCES